MLTLNIRSKYNLYETLSKKQLHGGEVATWDPYWNSNTKFEPSCGSKKKGLNNFITADKIKQYKHLCRIVVNLSLVSETIHKNHNMKQYWHEVIQFKTIQCNTKQYNTIQYNAIQSNTIQCNTMQWAREKPNNKNPKRKSLDHDDATNGVVRFSDELYYQMTGTAI